jgi:DNA-binding response OmpR family regulator
MIVMIVTDPGKPRGLLAYAFDLAGMDTREVLSVYQADSLVLQFGSRNCVLVIEVEALESGTWRAFLRSRSRLPVVVTACAAASYAIRDLVAEEGRILLEDPFDAAAVVAAVRTIGDLARYETPGGNLRAAAVACGGGGP